MLTSVRLVIELILMEDRCTPKTPLSTKSVWMHPMELLGVWNLIIGPFGDSVRFGY
jgi:hypothetical protein